MFRNQLWIKSSHLHQSHMSNRKILLFSSNIKFSLSFTTSIIRKYTLATCRFTMFIHVCIIHVFLTIAEVYSLFASFITMFQYFFVWGPRIPYGHIWFSFHISLYIFSTNDYLSHALAELYSLLVFCNILVRNMFS